MRKRFCDVERDGQILIVTMNRPQKMNAITAPDAFEMSEIFDSFDADPQMRVCILTGAGKAFTAGHDLLNETTEPMPDTGFAGLTERKGFHKPVIAAVNGYALGGGLGLAMVCDIIVAAEDAELGIVQGHIGGLDLSGGPHRLPRRIPYHLAMGMVLTGRRYKASELYRFGLINEVVPSDRLMETAKRWANEIIACAPLSVRVHKQLAQDSAEGDAFVNWVAQTQKEFSQVEFASEDLWEGIKAFSEKRNPVWKGR